MRTRSACSAPGSSRISIGIGEVKSIGSGSVVAGSPCWTISVPGARCPVGSGEPMPVSASSAVEASRTQATSAGTWERGGRSSTSLTGTRSASSRLESRAAFALVGATGRTRSSGRATAAAASIECRRCRKRLPEDSQVIDVGVTRTLVTMSAGESKRGRSLGASEQPCRRHQRHLRAGEPAGTPRSRRGLTDGDTEVFGGGEPVGRVALQGAEWSRRPAVGAVRARRCRWRSAHRSHADRGSRADRPLQNEADDPNSSYNMVPTAYTSVAGVSARAARLLGRHVRRRAEDVAGDRWPSCRHRRSPWRCRSR